jgi:TPR repeat protein
MLGKCKVAAEAFLLLALLYPTTSQAGPYEDGDLAFRRKNYEGAMKLWYPIAVAGHPAAQLGVATLYYNGRGVALDYRLAFEWFSKAAEQGIAQAQYMLGALYRDGKGVAQDEEKAVVLFRQAAERGIYGAQYSLGLSYLKGSGVVVDYSEAYYWLSLAARASGRDNVQLRTTAKYLRNQAAAKLSKEEISKVRERVAVQKSAPLR